MVHIVVHVSTHLISRASAIHEKTCLDAHPHACTHTHTHTCTRTHTQTNACARINYTTIVYTCFQCAFDLQLNRISKILEQSHLKGMMNTEFLLLSGALDLFLTISLHTGIQCDYFFYFCGFASEICLKIMLHRKCMGTTICRVS